MIIRIYLDTNVLKQSHWPQISAQLEELFSLAELFKVEVCIPEPVLDELRGQWVREFEGKRNQLLRVQHDIRDRARIVGMTPKSVPPVPTEAMMRAYDAMVGDLAAKQHLSFVPYTKRPLAEIFRASVYQQPPFLEDDKKDAGFKDAVIYYSIEDHLKANPVQAAFITSDKRFSEKRVLDTILTQNLLLTVEGTIEAATGELMSYAKTVLQGAMERDHAQAIKFLQGQGAHIEQFVTENLELSPREFSGVVGYKLEKISRIEMHKISSVVVSPLPWNRGESGDVKITFDASFIFQLSWAPSMLAGMRTMLIEPVLKVGVGVVPSQQSFETESEPAATQERMLQIEAVATYSNEGYSSLACQNVFVKYLPSML